MDNAKLYKPQKMKYFLVIDQGTSSTRAILFDEKFAVVNVSQTEFKQFFPKDGWVEHDANEIFDTVVGCIKDVMEKSETTHKEIIAIGITNQRETCLLWDKKGNPLGKQLFGKTEEPQNFVINLKKKGKKKKLIKLLACCLTLISQVQN